jgi:hypothetical protein
MAATSAGQRPGGGSFCTGDRAEEQERRRGAEEEEEREKVPRTGLEILESSRVSWKTKSSH